MTAVFERLLVLFLIGVIAIKNGMGGAHLNINATDISQFKTISGRKKWVFGIFSILLVSTIVAFFSDLLEAQLIQRTIDGEAITEAEAVSNDTRQAIIAVVYTIFFSASAVVFLMWIHRAHRNLISLGALKLRFTPGWAVGWFFVPIMSLFVHIR